LSSVIKKKQSIIKIFFSDSFDFQITKVSAMDPEEARAAYAKMSPEQRQELAEMMDKQLDEYMDKMERTGEKKKLLF